MDKDDIVKSRTVTLADQVGDLWLVKDGLVSEDRVVIDGLQKVASGMKVTSTLTEFQSQTTEPKK